MIFDESADFYKASISVDARSLNARAVLTARLESVEATTRVTVVRKEQGPNFEIRLDRVEDWGFWRAVLDPEPRPDGTEAQVIKIAANHPAIRPYLGESFEHQHSPVCRNIMAEAVADLAARMVVTELFRIRRTTESFDVDRYYREHYKRMSRFLPRFQKILVDVAIANESAAAPKAEGAGVAGGMEAEATRAELDLAKEPSIGGGKGN